MRHGAVRMIWLPRGRGTGGRKKLHQAMKEKFEGAVGRKGSNVGCGAVFACHGADLQNKQGKKRGYFKRPVCCGSTVTG